MIFQIIQEIHNLYKLLKCEEDSSNKKKHIINSSFYFDRHLYSI